jgi:hypothetical protein
VVCRIEERPGKNVRISIGLLDTVYWNTADLSTLAKKVPPNISVTFKEQQPEIFNLWFFLRI